MRKVAMVLSIVGFGMIALGILITVIDMLIDHQCYQLAPNDFYQSTICERYWNNEEK